jgi:hypothetical protein
MPHPIAPTMPGAKKALRGKTECLPVPDEGSHISYGDGGRTDGHTSCGAIAEQDVYGTKLHEPLTTNL